MKYPGREKLTDEWIKEFLTRMKEQKVIHKKYATQIVRKI
jgi:hypothetical protein